MTVLEDRPVDVATRVALSGAENEAHNAAKAFMHAPSVLKGRESTTPRRHLLMYDLVGIFRKIVHITYRGGLREDKNRRDVQSYDSQFGERCMVRLL